MKQFFEKILALPELKLFLDYWYLWVTLAVFLIYVSHLLSNKIRGK